jgi:hypothetical protein
VRFFLHQQTVLRIGGGFEVGFFCQPVERGHYRVLYCVIGGCGKGYGRIFLNKDVFKTIFLKFIT